MKEKQKNSYVVVMCRKGSREVQAGRFDDYERKTDLYPVMDEKYPDWNIKAVHKLYEEDFV